MLENLTGSFEDLVNAMISAAGKPESNYLRAEHVLPGIRSNMQAAVAQGPAISAHAMARDTVLITTPWPFDFQSLGVPAPLIHGQRDEIVHSAHLEALASNIQDVTSEPVKGTGHYSTLPLIWHLQSLDVSIV
jgi:pimeloyl-ACP methyl ester carboxylesterase